MKKYKVLLVDDEKEFVDSLSERLEMRDLKPKSAYNGEEALEVVETDTPDVMVLDLRMPGLDGMEVLEKVKEKNPDVQVVILTGHGTDKDEVQAKKLGAFEYMQKPVDVDSLVETLNKAYLAKFEQHMTAAAFAEAGEYDTARQIMDEDVKKKKK